MGLINPSSASQREPRVLESEAEGAVVMEEERLMRRCYTAGLKMEREAMLLA
jgi:hypothetical protein